MTRKMTVADFEVARNASYEAHEAASLALTASIEGAINLTYGIHWPDGPVLFHVSVERYNKRISDVEGFVEQCAKDHAAKRGHPGADICWTLLWWEVN